MENICLDEILGMIDWNNDEVVQNKGIEKAKSFGSVYGFIQPITHQYHKNVWGNCAVIVSAADNKTIEPFLYKLFEWVQDTNWPGAMTIYNRLLSVPREMLMTPYNKALQEAQNTHDELWEEILIDFMRDYEIKHKIREL